MDHLRSVSYSNLVFWVFESSENQFLKQFYISMTIVFIIKSWSECNRYECIASWWRARKNILSLVPTIVVANPRGISHIKYVKINGPTKNKDMVWKIDFIKQNRILHIIWLYAYINLGLSSVNKNFKRRQRVIGKNEQGRILDPKKSKHTEPIIT